MRYYYYSPNSPDAKDILTTDRDLVAMYWNLQETNMVEQLSADAMVAMVARTLREKFPELPEPLKQPVKDLLLRRVDSFLSDSAPLFDIMISCAELYDAHRHDFLEGVAYRIVASLANMMFCLNSYHTPRLVEAEYAEAHEMYVSHFTQAMESHIPHYKGGVAVIPLMVKMPEPEEQKPIKGEAFYDRNGSKNHIVECFTDDGVEMVTYKFWNRIQKWEYICEERSAFLRHFEDDWRWA